MYAHVHVHIYTCAHMYTYTRSLSLGYIPQSQLSSLFALLKMDQKSFSKTQGIEVAQSTQKPPVNFFEKHLPNQQGLMRHTCSTLPFLHLDGKAGMF